MGRRPKSNRRVSGVPRAPGAWTVMALTVVGRKLLALGQGLATVAFLGGLAWGADHAVRRVVSSPRLILRDIRISPVAHVERDEVLALAAVEIGDSLLSLDTKEVAARLATHPWFASARVSRSLPSALDIELVERRPAAVVVLGAFYLIDDTGRVFKRATVEDADGLLVVTGIDREQYATLRAPSEAAFREALGIAAQYDSRPDRPPLSEVHIDPVVGFALTLRGAGAEIRLGRGDYARKLERLDTVLQALGPDDAKKLEIIHLDDDSRDRVPVRLAAD